jgi:hypothetical protein
MARVGGCGGLPRSLPARQILTGAGPLEVTQPRVRDKSPEPSQRVRFSSSILPAYLRKSKAIEELIPWLYLKGISTGDFSDALQALVGPEAQGLSANVIVRLKEPWSQERLRLLLHPGFIRMVRRRRVEHLPFQGFPSSSRARVVSKSVVPWGRAGPWRRGGGPAGTELPAAVTQGNPFHR